MLHKVVMGYFVRDLKALPIVPQNAGLEPAKGGGRDVSPDLRNPEKATGKGRDCKHVLGSFGSAELQKAY